MVFERNLQETNSPINSPEQSASPGLSRGFHLLVKAAENNHVANVKLLLDRGCPVNASEPNTNSPLHLAAENGNFEIMELLLCKGADVNSKNEAGKTALAVAVGHEDLRIVRILLEHGADTNAEDVAGRTPLHFDSVDKCKHWPDLRAGSEIAQLKIAELLLNEGANVNVQTETGETALHISIESGLSPLTDLFLRSNADVNLANKDGLTALHFAVRVGNKRIASDLLAKGSDVNAKSSDGTTPLHEAALHGHIQVAEVLLANGVSPFHSPNEHGPRQHEVDLHLMTNMLRKLLSWGEEVNSPDTCVSLPFQRPHEYKQLKVMGTGLSNGGAEVNSKTDIGRTALHIAAEKGHAEFVKNLIQSGAQVNCKDNKGESPLHRASDQVIVEILLRFGANVDCRSKDGRTPLHFMSSSGCDKAVATLLEYGADINIKCGRSRTPWDWTHCSAEGLLLAGDWMNLIRLDRTRDVLQRRQAEMKAIGLPVEESQFSARHEETLEGFRKSCQEEVLLLRSEFFKDTSVSYYDFVRKDVRFLAKYMDNENVVQAAELGEYGTKFPMYASMIKSKFRRGWARNKWVKAAHQVLQQLTDLSDDCTEKIMDYLCDDDLVVLIDV